MLFFRFNSCQCSGRNESARPTNNIDNQYSKEERLMGMLDFLFPKVEERAQYNVTDKPTIPLDQAFSLDGLFSTEAITEDKILKIPTAKACVELISGTIAQMPVYLYKENADGSIEKVEADERVDLVNHEANAFLSGYNLKRNMVKDYLVHGASYVAKFEAGNRILELNPLPATSVLVNKRIQNGYRTVGAEIVLAHAEAGAYNQQSKVTKFKPHEVMIALQETHDGLSSKGALHHGHEIFKQALSEMEYTNNLYENGALPLGLLKTNGRLNDAQVGALRASWKKLYSGVKNSAKTVVLQEGMEYEALSMNPNEIQMSATKANTNAEICKVFNVPEGLVNAKAGKQYVSIEQNNLHFLKTTLAPIIAAMEGAMDKSLLLESEKTQGFFFRFDTSDIIRSTEKERVDTTVAALNGGLFTVNEARAKFDLPALEEDELKTEAEKPTEEDSPDDKDTGTESD